MQQLLCKLAILVSLLTGTGVLKAQQQVIVIDKTEKGEKGEKGAKGEKGEKGEKGDKDEKPILSKQVSIETGTAATPTVFIENMYRNVYVKTSTDNKIKIVTTAFYTEDNKLTDAEWFEKLNIELRGSGNMIVIKSGGVNVSSTYSNQSVFNLTKKLADVDTRNVSRVIVDGKTVGNGQVSMGTVMAPAIGATTTITTNSSSSNSVAVLKDGKMASVKGDYKREITIYVPAGAKLDIENKYANVEIGQDVNELKAKITNGNLVMGNASRAIVMSQYGNITAGNIDDAQLEITNGRLHAKNMARVDVDSKYSTVELGNCGEISIRSVNDQYEIDQVTSLTGRKNYGNLRITSLTNSLNLDGSNADIKIRSIEPTVDSIRVDNKYADLRFPVNYLKNYAVNFDGKYCSVYAPFEKVAIKETEPEKDTKAADTKAAKETTTIAYATTVTGTVLYGSGGNWGEGKDAKFTAAVGDTKSKHTIFNLKCTNCTVDFK